MIKFRKISFALAVCLIVVFVAGCASFVRNFTQGCQEPEPVIHETAYFRYIINTRTIDGISRESITLLSLTEHGAEQRFLVVPEHINGIRVVQIGRMGRLNYAYASDAWISDYL